jgi:hypothetical protein
VISEEDRDHLRRSPAFRRAVWGLRLITLAPLFVLLIFLLVSLGVPPEAGEPMFSVVFASGFVGVGLGVSSIMSLEKIKRAVLVKYQLDSFEMTLLMNGMLFRDTFRHRKAPGTPDR